jgi:hydroxymethylpyrimidine pyrophosphatase-like HAD family hydrolase
MQSYMNFQAIAEHKRAIFFDIDGTLKGIDGFPKLLPFVLHALKQSGWELGICTSRSPRHLDNFLVRFESNFEFESLFNSWLILEDGHVIVPPGGSLDTDSIILTQDNALVEMRAFEELFKLEWNAAADDELARKGWGYLKHLNWPAVQLTPHQWRPIGTVNIWELGPNVTSPDYCGEFENVMQWILEVAVRQKFHSLEFSEVGNGTLCIGQVGMNKGTGLTYTGIDMSRVIFIGDGYNDVPVARLLRKTGGVVVAVSNAVPELKELADYVTKEPSSYGVLEFVQKVRGYIKDEE